MKSMERQVGGIPIRALLFSVVAFAALPPLLFSTYLILFNAHAQRERAEETLVTSARGIARAIDAEFAVAVATLTALRDSSPLQDNDLAAFTDRLSRTSSSSRLPFVLLDADGASLIATISPARSTTLPFDRQRAEEAYDRLGHFISDVFQNPAIGGTSVMVSIPVFRYGAVQAHLATIVDGARFAAVMRQPGVPGDWIVSVVDRHGRHLIRSHNNENFAGHTVVPDLVRHLQARRIGTLRTISLEGIPLISTIAYARDGGWATAVGLPIDKLEAPYLASLRSMSVVGVILIGGTLVLAVLLGGILLRGYRALDVAARSLDRDELPEPPRSAIREVNATLATMRSVSGRLTARRETIEALNASLETQVIERTANWREEMRRREETETQLHHLHRIESVGKLTGGIAHDFNNMLAIVIGALSLSQRRLAEGTTDIGSYIDRALQGAQSAAALTRRLLAFARRQALRPEEVNCNRLILSMSELLRHTIREDIEIETALAGGLWLTSIDVSGLENTILNLAVNARDAMPEGGKLTIETSNATLDDAYAAQHAEVIAGQYVQIAVTDSGHGIPADIIDKVFDPFFTTKETGGGTGLGLSQVHGFIKQSGGHIKLYSEPGRGTTVKLYLPRCIPVAVNVAPTPLRARSASPAGDGRTILVVEDDPLVRAGAVEMVRELGYAVIDAGSGAEAMALLRSHPEVALLFTDVVMPGMNGRELADAAMAFRPALPVLFTTGYTQNAIVHQGILDRGVHLIGKPYGIGALGAKLAAVLAQA